MPLSDVDKLCTGCETRKPLAQFHAHKRGKHGRAAICKVCDKTRVYAYRAAHLGAHAKIQKAYHQRHPERSAIDMVAWLAAHPGYEAERTRRRWADPEQRPKMQAAKRKWGQKNKPRLRAHQRNHRGRKRANGGSVTTAELVALLKKPCAYCGKVATEADHVVPLSRGGRHEIANLNPACRHCNASKGDKLLSEWKGVRLCR